MKGHTFADGEELVCRANC